MLIAPALRIRRFSSDEGEDGVAWLLLREYRRLTAAAPDSTPVAAA